MNKILKSKICAWLAFALMIVILGFSFRLRQEWWMFFDIFFAFMMTFCHLVAVYVNKLNLIVSERLDLLALIFGICTVLSMIVEYILFTIFIP